MSAPPPRHGRTTPLRERSQSQNNTLAIRIVPYTPPRLDHDGRTPSQASSRAQANYDQADRESFNAPAARRPSWRAERTEGHASNPGSALSSPSGSSFSLARAKDGGVSGSKRAASPSALGPGGPTAPALRSPSEVSTNIASINAPSPHGTRVGESPTAGSPASSSFASLPQPRPLSRRANVVALHSDKTFSLVRQGPRSDVSLSSLQSPPLSYSSRTSSSHDRPSIDAWSDDRPSSAFTGTTTTALDYSVPELVPFAPSPGPPSKHLVEDPITSSPWNYRMVGGLRKVPKTPDLKQKKVLHNTATPVSETPLAPLPEDPTAAQDDEESLLRTIVPKASFASASTASETTNYKVYGPDSSILQQSSNDSLALPSSSHSHSNWEVLANSSSPSAPFSSSPPATSYSNENFVLHGDPSPSSSIVTVPRKPRPTYSQESLVVLPLRPAKKKSYERIGYYKQRSRENLRARAGSLQSLKSISSIISTQDPSQAFLAAPVLLNFGAPTSSRGARGGDLGSTSQQQQQQLPQYPWSTLPVSGPSTGSTTTPSAFAQRPSAQMTQVSPHQWSSQLSTVMSESEGESERATTRSVSPSTGGNGHMRRSSAGWTSSMHSRQLQSISSSLAAQLEEATSGSEPLDRPQPTYSRAGVAQARMIRDQDEHGDGLADLQEQPSRTGLSAFFSSSNSSSRGLHSSGSSRANSLNSSSIPAWARVYYGSGERRFLGAPSFVSLSETGDSRPGSSALPTGESPNGDHFPMNIYSSRRRAKEVRQHPREHPFSDSASLEIGQAPPLGHDYGVIRTLKRKTSSIWSPHLRMDRRSRRYSVWDPPSVSWSADTGIMGKRNAQVMLFIIGFILPFAWMVAALLPLPPNPKLMMTERDHSQPEFAYHPRAIDETRYENAHWWRNLNRAMSVVGLLIIGAIVALVVVGVRQGWVLHASS
ncbi:hypothetical protein B0T25DRAFT_604316 [Lasiosphaeria hispida]|uniref:Serine-rich protein n=1 Tax=Lasiosphaeria hispida TaxID=260671 RepID=A0AAJ0HMS3_9PEZI|nr:hypothetical protein B0T25DRAFT_604316 [Lasiosphaeria hispida]